MRSRAFILPFVAAATLLTTLAVDCAMGQLLPSFGRDRAGTSGYQFLKIPVDARSAAMSQTVASNAFDVSSLFWNPALAAQVTHKTAFGAGYTGYFADVSLSYLGLLHQVGSFKVGLSVQSMISGDMDVTTEFQPFGTGETFQAVDLAAGLTLAQQLTDLFSYGVTARYVQESLAEIHARTVVFDTGIFYRVGATGAQMAVVIQNFGFDSSVSGEIERVTLDDVSLLENEFESYTPPTTFLLGLTYNVFHRNGDQDLTVSAQLNNPNDNAESLNIGVEYVWQQILALRSGYRFGVEEATTPSFGIGLMIPGNGPSARFDYAFTSLGRLGAVHRVGIELNF
ncbi:PorV/PorQ family protein [Bacteroidota bacterium]